MMKVCWAWLFLFGVAGLPGCAGEVDDHGHEHGDEEEEHSHEDESWAVTSWGEHFEIFAEADPLIVGETVNSHTHVTVLRDFSPLLEGVVSAVLRNDEFGEQVFTRDEALRGGIFDIAITPEREGRFNLFFRVEGAGLTEEIPSGEVIVGTEAAPGGMVTQAGEEDGDTISFLKEQQWKTPFATAWANTQAIRNLVRGTGLLKPAAGGEMLLSASIDGVVLNEPWPYLGLSLRRGAPVFSLSSRASQGRTLGELEALETEKAGELALAQERLTRLEGLLPVQAVSEADVASARSRVRTLQAQYEAARRELESARGKRSNAATSGQRVQVSAPFAGEIAEVLVSPGQAVSAGQALGRIVRVNPVWVEVYIAPEDVAAVLGGVEGLWLRPVGANEPLLFDSVKLVSLSPQVNARTGRVECLLEISGDSRRVRLGSAVEAEVLVSGTRTGVVVPSAAVVDDSGASVVYVQLDGEGFSRQAIEVLGREGGLLLVKGISVGDRIVTKGGAAIRRATMVNAGVGHGHAH